MTEPRGSSTGSSTPTAADVVTYIERLVDRLPELLEIWLLGSRANGKEHSQSDWDLLLFGSETTLQSLTEDNSLNRAGVDLLLTTDDEHFSSPWGTHRGSLVDWQWRRVSENRAAYEGKKWKADEHQYPRHPGVEHGEVVRSECTALLLWSTAGGWRRQILESLSAR